MKSGTMSSDPGEERRDAPLLAPLLALRLPELTPIPWIEPVGRAPGAPGDVRVTNMCLAARVLVTKFRTLRSVWELGGSKLHSEQDYVPTCAVYLAEEVRGSTLEQVDHDLVALRDAGAIEFARELDLSPDVRLSITDFGVKMREFGDNVLLRVVSQMDPGSGLSAREIVFIAGQWDPPFEPELDNEDRWNLVVAMLEEYSQKRMLRINA